MRCCKEILDVEVKAMTSVDVFIFRSDLFKKRILFAFHDEVVDVVLGAIAVDTEIAVVIVVVFDFS